MPRTSSSRPIRGMTTPAVRRRRPASPASPGRRRRSKWSRRWCSAIGESAPSTCAARSRGCTRGSARRVTTVGLVLSAAWLLTLLLSAWLQRIVADPLLRLTATAREVSARQDYRLRASSHGRDEIGVLVTAFNDMLSQIERRDAELLASTQQLEQRVAERTEQLRHELDRAPARGGRARATERRAGASRTASSTTSPTSPRTT